MINEKNKFLTVSWLSGLLSAEIFISTGELQMPPLTAENSHLLPSGSQGATLVMCWINVNFAYFGIRIYVGLLSECCRFIIGLISGLSVCCRLRFQHCANERFAVGVVSVIYRSQIGRFHTESYPKWPRHEPDWFYGVFSNIVGGRQQADSMKILCFLSVSCRFGRCDWGITANFEHAIWTMKKYNFIPVPIPQTPVNVLCCSPPGALQTRRTTWCKTLR